MDRWIVREPAQIYHWEMEKTEYISVSLTSFSSSMSKNVKNALSSPEVMDKILQTYADLSLGNAKELIGV